MVTALTARRDFAPRPRRRCAMHRRATIDLGSEPMETGGRSAFRLVSSVFSEQGWAAVEAPRCEWHRALLAKIGGEKTRAARR